MYYKAILYKTPKPKLVITRLNDISAICLSTGIYGFTEQNNGSGIYAVRKTKTRAIKAIHSEIEKDLLKLQQESYELNKILTYINSEYLKENETI